VNKPLDQINFFAPDVLENPFDFYQAALAEQPVLKLPETNIYLVLGYDLINEACKRIDEFSNDFGAILSGQRAQDPDVKAILDQGWPQRDTMLTADPPAHTRYRKLVNLAFSMRRVDAMEADIRSIARGLLDRMAPKGAAEFVHDFAVPLPVAVIAEQIGLTRDDAAMVKRWSDAFADRLGGMISKERELACAREVVEFQKFMKGKLDERRARPVDDLLSDLVNARIEDERPLDDADLLSILQQLMVAGNETTTSTIAGGLLLLINNPGELAKVRADRSLIPNMVEEMLRLESPSAGLWRVVKRDAELGGVRIPAGSMLMVRFAAGNRDPGKYEAPDRFVADRTNARTQMAFGKGIHMCVGNMLARKELVVAFEEILDRLDDIALAPGADLSHVPNMLLRGLKQLDITFRDRLA
jgi:cytochrome P450